ncbi:ankyrin repeat domain-containing protein 40 [Biomphalaria glabrata]|nr:ankyrin repeat domain-containing protein 40 [Biomphalaria glabrata]
MSLGDDIGERLREAACVGDLVLISKLESQGVDINSKNTVNGWTALHWACKRNHGSVVKYLLEKGADKAAQSNDGLIPAQLTSNEEIRQMLGASQEIPTKIVQLPITPNYLSHPPFAYATKDSTQVNSNSSVMNASTKSQEMTSCHKVNNHLETQNEELVLKARIANSDERDFIEVELSLSTLTFTSLINLLCAELGVDKNLVAKIRKLPDTIVRKDKDVRRLKDFQELELVLTNKAMSSASRTYCLGPARNAETILY